MLHFLFLQGLPSPFFTRVAWGLAALGCRTTGINLCMGDTLFWKGPRRVDFRGRYEDWPRFIADFMDREAVTDLVLLGEQRGYHREAIAEAQARGIRVTVTDFGYLRPDWITLERDGMGGNSHFPRDPGVLRSLGAQAPKADLTPKYRDDFWTMALAGIRYHVANVLYFWRYPHYRIPYRWDHPMLHYPAIAKRLMLARLNHRRAVRRMEHLQRDGEPYFLFPLQLENDFQIQAYSPYKELAVAISEVISSFARRAQPAARLLIKMHPLEPGVRNWKRLIGQIAKSHAVADRVEYFDGGELDVMIRGAQGMVTVNSTSGMRALQLGCPLKVLGQAIFDVPGLCHQGILDQFWTNATPPDHDLVEAFINVLAASIQLRGVFYAEPGLTAAVEASVRRLYAGRVGEMMPGDSPGPVLGDMEKLN